MVSKLSTFSKKRKSILENTIATIVFIVLFLGIVGFFAFQNVKIGSKRAELQDQLATLQAQVAVMETQRQDLEKGIENTQTEEYQEKLLREQGLYKKPGEEVVTILQEEGEDAPVQEEEKQEHIWWKPWTW